MKNISNNMKCRDRGLFEKNTVLLLHRQWKVHGNSFSEYPESQKAFETMHSRSTLGGVQIPK
jgi:hypothetical protein